MTALNLLSWACFVLAGILTVLAIGEGAPIILAAAISLAVSGVLFLALNKIITTLIEIRDAVRGEHAASASTSSANLVGMTEGISGSVVGGEVRTPTKSLAELSEELERLKKGKSL